MSYQQEKVGKGIGQCAPSCCAGWRRVVAVLPRAESLRIANESFSEYMVVVGSAPLPRAASPGRTSCQLLRACTPLPHP